MAAKKKAIKGTYSRERDAKAAALKTMKEDEFEICAGPKGFSIRVKKTWAPVTGAKLHGPHGDPTGDLEQGDDVTDPQMRSDLEKSQGLGTIANPSEKLQEASDPTGGAGNSQSSSDPTNAGLVETGEKLVTPVPVSLLPAVAGQATVVIEDHPAVPYRVQCPTCQQMIETFGIEGARFFIEHDDEKGNYCSESEESIPPEKSTGLPTNNFKPHELAQIKTAAEENAFDAAKAAASNERGEQIRPITSHLRRSTIESPSKRVWDIAAGLKLTNPTMSRKEIIKHCESLGIAHYTARTQYQQWLKATRESDANAALANTPKT